MTKSFANFNKHYNYVFLDESGNSVNAIWNKIDNNIKEHGFLKRELSTFTISGVFVRSKNQYTYLTRDLRKLKQKILQINPNIFVHRTDLKSVEFLNANAIENKTLTWKFESELLNLVPKHKLPIFSVSFNREIIYQKPTFNLQIYLSKFNIIKACVEKMIRNLFAFLDERYKHSSEIKKTILVFEVTDKKKEKLIQDTYNTLLLRNPDYKKYFRAIMFCTKLDKNKKPIAGNELIDFINYGSWQWASNFYYQKTKIQFPKYPAHLKKSISIIDIDIYKPKFKKSIYLEH